MTVGWVDAASGASGDMLLGALIDAGIGLDDLREVLAGLRLDGWQLDATEVLRGGLRATQALVRADADGSDRDAPERTWGSIRALLEEAALPEVVRARALGAFGRLARAEARVHRQDEDDVHFHEVGGVDAIVDVVGVCAGLHLLGVEVLRCERVALGSGTARAAHGVLPVPAPAVLELLRGAPVAAGAGQVELCTPTGAALLAEWVGEWGRLPSLRVEAVGYGAGTRELDHPNVLRLVVGDAAEGHAAGGPEQAIVLETTVDDLAGELVPPVLTALLDAGASDAWARPVLMKKGRPGLEIACLAALERAEALRRVLFRETTTLGVRGRVVDKWALDRRFDVVEVADQQVRVKVGLLDGRVVNVAPEFEDCAAVARATGLALKEVFARARAAWDNVHSE